MAGPEGGTRLQRGSELCRRLFVEDSVHDRFVERVVAETRKIVTGGPLDRSNLPRSAEPQAAPGRSKTKSCKADAKLESTNQLRRTEERNGHSQMKSGTMNREMGLFKC
ncbi:hypothetical protein HPB52_023828 [Rhipicephalus sanguineus]|uniref:Uncharacterized protein n=1 Tax=Rhipicephalus sanguineus TaxID=34632 RepID=A0A9D4SVL7_RHISA|nr:hypothetical protein HPB52_023828 [Rhipicephalus sanguineus]